MTTLEAAGNMFTFQNPCCNYKVTTEFTNEGIEYHRFLILKKEGFHKYAYTFDKSMVMINDNGSIKEKALPVEHILNIDLKNTEELGAFFQNYGFLIPIQHDGKFTMFDHLDISHTIKRFRVLVNLIETIQEEPTDFDKILKSTVYLLFAKPRNEDFLVQKTKKNDTLPYIHRFTEAWFRYDDQPKRGDLVYLDTGEASDDYYPVFDTITNQTEHLSGVEFDEYFDQVDLQTACSPRVFRAKITRLYRDAFNDNIDISTRHVIDFFYHLLRIGVEIDDIPESGRFQSSVSLNSHDRFDDALQSRLTDIAKNTIKAEFDFALHKIHPSYNPEKSEPDWVIPSFLSALYFSLFYTSKNHEVYRKCANPTCNCMFLVKTTNSKKRYHDFACQNKAAQMRYRVRQKHLRHNT